MANNQTLVKVVASAALALACLLTPLPALAQAKQKVVVWGVNYGPDSKGIEAAVAEFQELHPEFEVKVLSLGAGQMDPQKLMTAIVGEVAPDVIAQDRFTVSDWASRGAFMSLDDFQKNDTDPAKPTPEQYYPATWQEAMYNGHLYGIPTGVDDRIMYWNKQIFRENADALKAEGLDPTRPPRTWSEVLKYSKVLTKFDDKGNLVRAGFMPNYGNPWLYIYAFQNNASFMSPDGRKCTLDTPAAETALQFMVDGYKLIGGYEKAKAFENGFGGKENDAFIAGKVAMKIDGDWIMSPLAQYGPHLDFGTCPAPVPDDRLAHRGAFANEKEDFVTWTGGFCYSIPTGARNPKGGWEFIKYISSVRGRLKDLRTQRLWEQHQGRIFIPRLAASIEMNNRIWSEFHPADSKFAEALKWHIDMLPHARMRPATFVAQRLWNEHTRAIENGCTGRLSPKQALMDSQAIVQSELDQVFNQEKYPVLPSWILQSIIGGAIVLLSGLLFWNFKRQKLGTIEKSEAKWGYIFISPWLVGFFILTLGPMLASLYFSFTQYTVLQPPRWIGMQNYADIVGSDRPMVLKALMNAAYLAGLGTTLGLVTGLAIALLLNMAVSGMRFYRTMFYMPSIVPTIASAVLWSWVLNADPNRGLINGLWNSTITRWLGFGVPGWLQSEAWSKPALIMMGVWGAGGGMILWLAGLKGVPQSLYEAASLDGASSGKQLWRITLPHLSPIIFFNMVMGVIGALQDFDRIYVLRPSKDGPIGVGDSMLVPVYHLFQNAFSYFKTGYASALAWGLFALILTLTLFQMSMRKYWVYQEVDN